METLYSSIEICRVLDNFKETRKYYILKDDTYGIKISIIENDELVEKEVFSIKNIVGSEEKVKELIEKVINCDNNLEQIKYIVEDYVENIYIFSFHIANKPRLFSRVVFFIKRYNKKLYKKQAIFLRI